jgi:hypothetical protein
LPIPEIESSTDVHEVFGTVGFPSTDVAPADPFVWLLLPFQFPPAPPPPPATTSGELFEFLLIKEAPPPPAEIFVEAVLDVILCPQTISIVSLATR